MYIATEKNILIPSMNANITSYGIQDFKDIQESNHYPFDYSHGVKIDGKNHNWVCFRQFIALGFSYMSFLINSHQEGLFNLDDDDDEFDETAYNYLFNKSTSFIDGNFVKNDHKRLSMVLEGFEASDTKMLELLNYV